MNRDDSDVENIEMHYRVTLDFRMLVRPITHEVCEESLGFNNQSPSAAEPDYHENVERQRRLYKLLRDNQPLLDQYLLSALTQEAGNLVYEGLPDAFDIRDEDEILAAVYKGMAEEDVQYFDECRAINALDANTELITVAVKVEWVGAEVEEMNRRLVGDVKRAEIVEKTKMRLMKKLISPR